MLKILLMSCICAIVDLLALCLFVYVLAWEKNTARAMLVCVLAFAVHVLIAPTPEQRANLHAFLKIPQK